MSDQNTHIMPPEKDRGQMQTQTTRVYGALVALVVLSAFAGCSALGGGSGSGCGPGDSKIENLEPQTADISIEGEVTQTRTGLMIVDDGTGKASVMVTQPDYESGDCVVVDGRAHTGGMGSPADIVIAPSNITSA